MNMFRYKLLAMILSSFLTGVGGTFYAFYLFSLQPGAVFGIPLSVEIIIRPIVGGAGTAPGPDPRLVHPDAARPSSRGSTSGRAAGTARTSSSTALLLSPWCSSCRRGRTRGSGRALSPARAGPGAAR